jgi:Na+-translocating ferredoxin:NAD+ oxidoreductase RNF subunit RnfB
MMNEFFTAVGTAVGIVTAVGLICALILVFASKFFAVKADEKEKKIRECLPGVNCGACGYTGCDGYAKALATSSGIKTNLCVPGADAVSAKISEILGVEFEDVIEQVAFVHCNGDCHNTEKKHDYQGIQSCSAAKLFYGGDGHCTYGCLGYGDCEKVCPNGAICLENGIAHVDPRKCTGCGLCAKHCPNGVIRLFPDVSDSVVTCSNKEKGAIARKKCKNACIGCKKCELNCPEKAVTVVDNLAQIDYGKCVNCGKCAEVCPVHAIKRADFSGIHRHK